MAEKNKDSRTRNWTVVVYPDSAPENWRELLDDKHIEWVESPLHDRDVNADGTPKKPHWHILLLFGGVKTFEQVSEFVGFLNCPIPVRVHNAKSLVRYMAHLDNPDKVQYDLSKIISHGGVDIFDLLKPTSAERYTYIREMQQWCIDTGCVEFQDLFDYAAANRFDDWFPLLCDNSAFVMTQYLKSKRHRAGAAKGSRGCNVDLETGEILD